MEDQKIIFSDVPVEIIKSVVELLYTGKCTLIPVSNVKELLDFMRSLGLNIQEDRLQVDFALLSDNVAVTNNAVTTTLLIASLTSTRECTIQFF